MEISEFEIELADLDKVKLPEKNLNGLFLNVRSLKSGDTFDKIKEYVDALSKVDIICLVETWLGEEDTKFYEISGYYAVHNTRPSEQRGGGIVCYIKNDIQCLNVSVINLQGLHFTHLKLKVSSLTFNLITVYNPSILRIIECTDQLDLFLNNIGNDLTFIIGDFNIDVAQSSVQGDQYLNHLANRGFYVVNSKVTRQQSATVIDHIVTNINQGQANVFTIENDISDHHIDLVI